MNVYLLIWRQYTYISIHSVRLDLSIRGNTNTIACKQTSEYPTELTLHICLYWPTNQQKMSAAYVAQPHYIHPSVTKRVNLTIPLLYYYSTVSIVYVVGHTGS